MAADSQELDAWKNSVPPEHEFGPELEPGPAPRSWRRWAWPAAGALVIVAVALAGTLVWRRRMPPAGFRVEGRSLVVLDEHGRELWTKLFDAPLADVYSGEQGSQHVWFGDLEGNGRPGVLFVHVPLEQRERPSEVLWYSGGGRLRWRYEPGRTVSTATNTFPPPYVAKAVAVADLGAGRGKTVVVCSTHSTYWPSQVTMLSPSGQPLREYWHAGHLNYVRVGDYDGDGRPDIVVAGTSNARGRATVVVLDPAEFGGASAEEDPHYRLLGLGASREKARVLFPRTCINRSVEVRNNAAALWMHPGEITVAVDEGQTGTAVVYYHLSAGLKLRAEDVSDGFRIEHRKLEASGALDHTLSPGEETDLRKLVYVGGSR